MKILIQDGKGKPINPYTSATYIREEAINFNKFRDENPPLIVLDENGLEYKEPGTYEAEKVRQYWGGLFPDDMHWINRPNFTDVYLDNDERFVYILTPNPTLEGKEEEKQKTPETIEQAAVRLFGDDINEFGGQRDGFKLGAQWQAKNSGLISKDAVISAITKLADEYTTKGFDVTLIDDESHNHSAASSLYVLMGIINEL